MADDFSHVLGIPKGRALAVAVAEQTQTEKPEVLMRKLTGQSPALNKRLETGLVVYFTFRTWTNGNVVGIGWIFMLAHPLPLVNARLCARDGERRE